MKSKIHECQKNNIKVMSKRIITVLILSLFASTMFAQAPQKISYQAIVRNASNVLVANANVGMRMSVLQGTANGTAVYVETQTATTNANGLVTLEIGAGTVVSGTFASISWGTNAYFIKTETDPTGGTNYTIVGTSQFLSVPYALFAANSNAGNSWLATGNINTNPATNFIGTTDNNDLIFKRNNVISGKIATDNTSYGNAALNPANSGVRNLAIGNSALFSNTLGDNNTAVGSEVLYTNIDGYSNAAFGNTALHQNTTGVHNAAIGSASLFHNIEGIYNTGVGSEALYDNTMGSFNTAVGFDSGTTITTGNNNMTLGANANVPSPTSDNQMSIGNVIYGADMTSTVSGKIGIGVPVPSEKLEVNGKTKMTNLQVTNGAGTGKVLTSDASGNATWQTSAPKIHFSSLLSNPVPIIYNTTAVVKWAIFEENNTTPTNYNPTTGEYTVLVPGYYSIYFDSIYSGGGGNQTGLVRSSILINGNTESISQMIVPNSEMPAGNCTTQREKWLNQGDKIKFTVLQNYSSVQVIEMSPYTQCGIHLIHN